MENHAEEDCQPLSEDWLMFQGIEEGDEWPEDIDGADMDFEKANIIREGERKDGIV